MTSLANLFIDIAEINADVLNSSFAFDSLINRRLCLMDEAIVPNDLVNPFKKLSIAICLLCLDQ